MPLGQLGADVWPVRYELTFDINPSEETFTAETRIDVILSEPQVEIWMHAKGIEVYRATAELPNGQSIDAEFEQINNSGSSRIRFQEIVPAGSATLYFSYSASFSHVNAGLFRSERDGSWYAASQLAPTHARAMFPSFDEPRFKVPFDIAVVTRADDVVISNTPATRIEVLDSERTYHEFATTEPLPTYLVAVAVGPYDVVTSNAIPPSSVRNLDLPLRAITVRGQGELIGYALRNTAGLLAAAEEYFGTPYPYSKLDFIAMPSSIGGAMENAGAIAYDEFLVLMDDASPVAQRRTFTYIHAHELAHMWFGDLVTPAWWDDIWLNEAFATWLSYKIAHDYWPNGDFDRLVVSGALRAMGADSLVNARRVRESVVRDVEIPDVFDGITYDKGAGVLAMLENFVGEEDFRAGVRRHIERFSHSVADSSDFMTSVALGSENPELVDAFRSFIDQPGVPLVEAQLECPDNAPPRVRIIQSRYKPLGSSINTVDQRWDIPVCITHLSTGERHQTCKMVSAREDVIELTGQSCPVAIHPNAQGSGYYRFSTSDASWNALVDNIEALSASEALTAVDSLDAAFRAGEVAPDAYISGLVRFSERPEWDIFSLASSRLVSIGSLLDANQYAGLQQLLKLTFRGRLRDLETENGDDALLARTSLYSLLALTAYDEDVRAELTTLAAARIGYPNASPDPLVIEPEFVETALSVAVQELGGPFFDELFRIAGKTSDTALRRAAINALARADDSSLAQRLRVLLLEGDLQGDDSLRVLRIQLARRATRLAAWEWVKANAEVVIAITPETFRSVSIPSFGQSFCSDEQADDLSRFVKSHADALPGHERSLAQTQEQISLCTVLRESVADDLFTAINAATR